MSICASPIKAEVARFTLLDQCGVPVVGEGSAQVTTDSFIEITATPTYEEGTRFFQRKANGDPCVNEQDPATLNWIEQATTLCTMDVDLIALMTGEDPIASIAQAEFVGVTFGEGLLDARFSKEVWQPVTGEGACTPDGTPLYVYWAFPHEYNAQIQAFTFANDVFNFIINSMTKKASPLWDIGNPWLADNPTSTWGPGKHYAFAITSVPPPEAACGAVEIGS